MAQEVFTGLINNLALLLVLTVIYNFLPLKRIIKNLFLEKIISGIFLGALCIFLIMNPWEIQKGVLFDARTMFIGLSALFFGPTPSVIMVLMTSLYRVSIGGIATWMSIATIITSAGIGLAWRFFSPKTPDEYTFKELFLLGLVLHVFPTIYLVMLPKGVALQIFSQLSLMIVIIYPFGTAILGKVLAYQHKQFKMEQALIESDFFLNRSQNAGGVGSFVLNIPSDDLQAQTWESSPEMDRIFGIDATYHRTGENWLALIVQRDEVEAYFSQQVFNTKTLFEKEYQITRPSDGEVRWIFGRGELEFDDQGNCIRMFGTIQDITERKRMEQSVRESEAQLRTLFDTIPDLIYLRDKNGVYLACNKMVARFFGAKEEDIVGKTNHDFLDKDIADRVRENDLKIIATGKPTSNEEWLTWKEDGHRAYYYFVKTPMYDSKGNFLGLLGVGRDITERQQLVDKLEKALSEIKTLSGMLPICASCKKIRDDKGYWNQIESYIGKHSDAEFSHSICPDCVKKLYPDFYESKLNGQTENDGS